MSTSVSFADGNNVPNAIKDVRNDATPTDWVLAAHSDDNPNLISLVGSGAGGIEEMKSHFDETKVQYGILRTYEQFDLSRTVKFVYIYLCGEKVPFVKKGRFGVVKGAATKFFEPFHIDFDITNPAEISEEAVKQKIQETAGTINKAHDMSFLEGRQERGFTNRPGNAKHTAPKAASSSSTKPIAVPTASSGVSFTDALTAAIADVRNDSTETNWVLGAYQDNDIKKPIDLVATGSGNASELASHLRPEQIGYGLVRATDFIDGHKTVKFCFIIFIGNSVSIMSKAKIATHKGAVSAQYAPYHVDISATETREVSDHIVMEKISAASGSKSFVKP